MLLATVVLCSARAAAEAKRRFNLPAGDAAVTLARFAEQADREIVFSPAAVRGVKTNAVTGEFVPREALDLLVARTPLAVTQDSATGALAVRKGAADPNGGRAASTMTRNAAPTLADKTTTGTITGRIYNAATGAYLEGARVVLAPSGRSVLTQRDGSFSFSELPAGEYSASVAYTGLDADTFRVNLHAGETVRREIALTSQIYQLAPFTVAGEREGNALAINLQRNAPNVQNVLSSDAFGNIADQNIGNLLVRLPGIAEEVSAGEIVGVSVRGIASDMNSVTVDGMRSASGSTGTMDRSFAIDSIPADFVDRIEVTKANTPDKDGDAIGGTINLRTKSPLDRKGRATTYMAGTSWNVDRNTFRPIATFSYSDVLGPERKLGLMVTSSFNRTHKPRDSVNQAWQTTANTSAPAYYWFSALGEDKLTHQRIGLGIRADYQLSSTHRVFVNTMYSDYKDTLDRRQITMSPSAAQIRPGWTDMVTETTNQTLTLTQAHRVRTVKTINAAFGGEKRFAGSLLDYGFSFSTSDGTEDKVNPFDVQVAGVGLRLDRSRDKRFPIMTQISGPAYTNRSNHRNSAFNPQYFDDADVIKGLHLDWKKPFKTPVPVNLKSGLRYRGQERDRDQSRLYYVYTGPDGVAGTADDNLGQFADLNYQYRSARGRYDPVPAVDPRLMLRHLLEHPRNFTFNVANSARDELQYDGRIKEEVWSAYLMGDGQIGRLQVLAGVRIEETRLSARGVRQEITPEEKARRAAWVGTVTPEETRRRSIAEWSNLREEDGQYRNALPSLHCKYHVTPDFLARLSYSTGIGRPNFSNLLRTTTVNNETMRIVVANPDLRPQQARNYDFALEYYFEPAGFLSAGVFRKKITDFIYGSRGETVGAGPGNGFDGLYEGYTVTLDANGGFARVNGLELSYNQRFNFLPGRWKGLGFMANYTRLDSKGQYNPADGIVTGNVLVGFTPTTFNAGLSYAYGAWDVRVKANYRSNPLVTYNANPTARVYRFPRTVFDLNVKYAWRPWLSFYVDVINVFDASLQDSYVYIRDRVRITSVYTPAVKAGISGRF